MKTIKLVSINMLSILFLAITFYSCSSDDDGNPQEEENYFVNAKIDGVDFMSDLGVPLIVGNSFAIGANNDSNTVNVQLFIENYTGPGTYISGENGNVFSVISDFVYLSDDTSSTFTISENSNSYTGTFSFTATSSVGNLTINVTEGSFKLLRL